MELNQQPKSNHKPKLSKASSTIKPHSTSSNTKNPSKPKKNKKSEKLTKNFLTNSQTQGVTTTIKEQLLREQLLKQSLGPNHHPKPNHADDTPETEQGDKLLREDHNKRQIERAEENQEPAGGDGHQPVGVQLSLLLGSVDLVVDGVHEGVLPLPELGRDAGGRARGLGAGGCDLFLALRVLFGSEERGGFSENCGFVVFRHWCVFDSFLCFFGFVLV